MALARCSARGSWRRPSRGARSLAPLGRRCASSGAEGQDGLGAGSPAARVGPSRRLGVTVSLTSCWGVDALGATLRRLIRQARYLDQEDAYAAGEVGILARALVQATLPHSDPRVNEFVRRNGHITLSTCGSCAPFGRRSSSTSTSG